MKLQKIMPPTYLLILIILSVGLHFALPLAEITSWPIKLLGIIILAVGAFLSCWVDAIFKKEKTTIKPFQKSTKLITWGPFRISRHPNYLGMLMVLLGESLILGSLITLVAPTLFIILMEALFIFEEERMLIKTFGEDYHDYKKKVRRWL
jgi:protein-S-isoprenylcysteine O-methyltransferase Ste14